VGIFDTKNKSESKFDVSPNPFVNNLRINAFSSKAGNYNVSITDVTGRLVQNYTNAALAGASNFSINTNGLANGTYFIKVITPDKNTFNTVVVKK
jgi:hypothetical protein